MQLTYKPKSKYLGVIRDQKSVTNNTESLNRKKLQLKNPSTPSNEIEFGS